jgi:feruloyl esterase
VREIEAVVQNAKELSTGERGLVSIAALPSVSSTVLPGIVARFREQSPGVAVTLKDVVAQRILTMVKAEDVDFGIGSFSDADPEDNPGYWMSREQGAMIRKKVLERCAGQGSGLPANDFVSNPGTCDFKPDTLLCRPGQDAQSCLAAPQLTMLKKIYAGVQNPANGHTIYPGNPFGTETAMIPRLGTLGGRARRGTSDLLNWAKGSAYNPATFDFNKDVEELCKTWGADINALSANLSAFEKRGGKLITYHGWQDTTVSPFDSINYYDRLADAKKFVRLFMVPGMGHCQGGPGLDDFGARNIPGQLVDPNHNIVAALDRWVTKGVAPEQLVATKWSGGGRGASGGPPRTIVATRPLCAYPKVARYNGSGDNTKAENYKCVAAAKAKYNPPAPLSIW